MQQQDAFFVGVDWATEAHEVSIVASDRTQLGGKSFENTATGLHALCAFIEEICGVDREAVAIGIEVPRGALVETMVERGFHVYSINPKQLDRFRDRHTPAGAKDDRLDAFVLGDSLRTDMPCFRRVSFDEPEMIEADGHSDAAILCSLPGVGSLVAAAILSEAAQAIAARDYDALRAHAGVAPVTKRSGKRLSVIMRQACNDRLRNALYHWARVSMQKDPVTKLKYASLRARGHSHGRALRGISDGLLRLLFGMLKGGSLFDVERRRCVA